MAGFSPLDPPLVGLLIVLHFVTGRQNKTGLERDGVKWNGDQNLRGSVQPGSESAPKRRCLA